MASPPLRSGVLPRLRPWKHGVREPCRVLTLSTFRGTLNAVSSQTSLSDLAGRAVHVVVCDAGATFTSSASFLASVSAGSYTNDFNGLVNPPPGPVLFAGNGFAYSAFAASDIYLAGGFLGTNQVNETLTITFTGSSVTAVGANFYATDISDVFQSVAMTITLSDGTIETFTPTSVANSYRGFVSQGPVITSLVLSGAGASVYAGLDNLTVGTNIPEPASWSLAVLAMAGLFAARRRAV